MTARFDYAQLDRDGAPTRIRLNSTAVRVRHVGDNESSREVEVTYVRSGRARRVRGRSCVLACYNAMIPYMCPELPEAQREALSYALKAPKVYTSVLIRNWKAFQRLGLSQAFCPGSYHDSVGLGDPISMGEYRCPRAPDEPMVLQLYRVPTVSGVAGARAVEEGNVRAADHVLRGIRTRGPRSTGAHAQRRRFRSGPGHRGDNRQPLAPRLHFWLRPHH